MPAPLRCTFRAGSFGRHPLPQRRSQRRWPRRQQAKPRSRCSSASYNWLTSPCGVLAKLGIFLRNSNSWRVGAAAAWRSARRPVGHPRARRRGRPTPPLLRGTGTTRPAERLYGRRGSGAPSSQLTSQLRLTWRCCLHRSRVDGPACRTRSCWKHDQRRSAQVRPAQA